MNPTAFTSPSHEVSVCSSKRNHNSFPLSLSKEDAERLQPHIFTALKKAAEGKATGVDHLFVEMFKADMDMGMKVLTTIWEQAGKLGSLPSQWTETLLVPIHKRGQPKNRKTTYL